MLECIVLGTGPSLLDFLLEHNKESLKGITLIGCGRLVIDVDIYCYGDPRRRPDVPDVETTEVYAHQFVHEPGMIRWQEEWPHGGTAGGMAVTVACLKFDRIGLIGFDGFRTPEFEHYDNFVINFNNEILDYWQARGKKLYSLMSHSIFNERLLKLDV